MKIKHLLALAAFFTAGSAYSASHIGAYFVADSTAEVDSSGDTLDLDGNGFGLFGGFGLGALGLSDRHSLAYEYSAVEYDRADLSGDGVGSQSVDLDFVQLRLGYNFKIPMSEKLAITAVVEGINFKLDSADSENGFGLHSKVQYQLFNTLSLYGQLGYVSVDDVDGPEVKIGSTWQVNDRYHLFADYRASRLEDDDADFEVDDLRIGIALLF